MIYSDTYKYVFLANGKTGTRTIYDVLTNEFRGIRGTDHTTNIPSKMINFFKFVSVRNPYTRAMSIYISNVIDGTKDTYGYRAAMKGMEINLYNFLQLARYKINTITQAAYLQHELNAIIEYENLEKDFNNLPFVTEYVKLPKNNVSGFFTLENDKIIQNCDIQTNLKNYSIELTAESITLINEIFYNDFQILSKYEMIK